MQHTKAYLPWALAGVAATLLVGAQGAPCNVQRAACSVEKPCNVRPALTLHAARCTLHAPPGRCTPSAPLAIELAPLPRQKGDDKELQRLSVRVTPRIAAPALEVTLALPPGVTLLRGESGWKAAARAGVTEKRELWLKVPPAGEQRIVATARLRFQRSLPMAAAAGYTYNENPVASPPAGPLQEPETLPRLGRG